MISVIYFYDYNNGSCIASINSEQIPFMPRTDEYIEINGTCYQVKKVMTIIESDNRPASYRTMLQKTDSIYSTQYIFKIHGQQYSN